MSLNIDDKLYLTHAYSDGYRPMENFIRPVCWKQVVPWGWCECTASSGDRWRGQGTRSVFGEYIYFGTFADSIVYELTDANEPCRILSEQAFESELCVRVYIEGDGDELKLRQTTGTGLCCQGKGRSLSMN